MSEQERKYTRVREVGSGSFGKAILVTDKENKLYVMKVIDISRMNSKERKEAMQEAKLLATLKHPYIVSFKDSWCDDHTLYIVMDYAEQGDLYHLIQKHKKTQTFFPEKQILRWFTQAVLAIKHMHDHHILHRDIKSSNFFLTSTGRIRAGDFGIAKVLESTASFARTTIGTPYYLAPEICCELPYSFAADIWSLGVLLYEMCALKMPFDGTSIKTLVDKIVKGPCPEVPSLYSQGVRSLVVELLQKKAENRPTIFGILQKPIIQNEIREMLREEKEKKKGLEEGEAGKGGKSPKEAGGEGAGSLELPAVRDGRSLTPDSFARDTRDRGALENKNNHLLPYPQSGRRDVSAQGVGARAAVGGRSGAGGRGVTPVLVVNGVAKAK